LLLVLAPKLFGFSPPLLWQYTPSEPKGLYWLRPLPDTLTPGMLVTLPVPPNVAELVFSNGWLPRSWHGAEVVLVKPIAGLAGDTFCVSEHGIEVNDVWLGPVYGELGGVALPKLRGCWPIQADQVLLVSSKLPNAFDGRYIGVVHRDALLREAGPLWTWE
jgi:type IV secretory pathway protease TraF